MKSEELLSALGEIDDEFIEEAAPDEHAAPKRSINFVQMAAMAAGVVFISAVSVNLVQNFVIPKTALPDAVPKKREQTEYIFYNDEDTAEEAMDEAPEKDGVSAEVSNAAAENGISGAVQDAAAENKKDTAAENVRGAAAENVQNTADAPGVVPEKKEQAEIVPSEYILYNARESAEEEKTMGENDISSSVSKRTAESGRGEIMYDAECAAPEPEMQFMLNCDGLPEEVTAGIKAYAEEKGIDGPDICLYHLAGEELRKLEIYGGKKEWDESLYYMAEIYSFNSEGVTVGYAAFDETGALVESKYIKTAQECAGMFAWNAANKETALKNAAELLGEDIRIDEKIIAYKDGKPEMLCYRICDANGNAVYAHARTGELIQAEKLAEG